MGVYRHIPDTVHPAEAERVLRADEFRKAREFDRALALLEDVLFRHLETSAELPDWLCGRLAGVYRGQKRYDKEIEILERYQQSQSADDVRTRQTTRIDKARAMADRVTVDECGALASIRAMKARRPPRRR